MIVTVTDIMAIEPIGRIGIIIAANRSGLEQYFGTSRLRYR